MSALLALACLLAVAPRGYEGPQAVEARPEPPRTRPKRPVPPAPVKPARRERKRRMERTRVGASGSERVPDDQSLRTWVVGAFVDAGYVVNSNLPDNHVNRGSGTAPRTGEFTVPYAAAYLRHDSSEIQPWQLEFALQVGPAAAALLVSEPEPGGDASKFGGIQVWQHIARANVGGRIPRAGTEISAGLFNTPISMWSFWSKDNFNYSTPWHLNAVPYVLMGGRIVQPVGKRLMLHAWVVNGWQEFADLNKVPSYLLGGIATPTSGLQIGQFVYFGPEDYDPRPQAWRMLSDTWVFYDAGSWGIAAAFDVMRERLTLLPDAPVALYVAGAIGPRVRLLEHRRERRFSTADVRWYLAARGEAFWDRDGRIYGVKQLLGSASVNTDLWLFDHLIVRLEYRYDRTTNRDGFFYRHAAIHDDDDGLGREQHAFYVTLTGMFEHWFGHRRKD